MYVRNHCHCGLKTSFAISIENALTHTFAKTFCSASGISTTPSNSLQWSGISRLLRERSIEDLLKRINVLKSWGLGNMFVERMCLQATVCKEVRQIYLCTSRGRLYRQRHLRNFSNSQNGLVFGEKQSLECGAPSGWHSMASIAFDHSSNRLTQLRW